MVIFGVEGIEPRTSSKNHAKDSIVDVVHKLCFQESCSKKLSICVESTKVRMY